MTRSGCRSLFMFLLAGCAGSPPVVDPGPAAASTPEAPAAPPVPAPTGAFPWPPDLAPPTSPRCVDVEAVVRAGRALEEDVWVAVLCVVERLPPAQVEAFTSAVAEFRERSRDFVALKVGAIPNAALRERAAKVVESERADRGEVTPSQITETSVAVYLTPENREAPVVEKHLSAGGWRGFCFPWQKREGHYGVTQRAAQATGRFSSQAVALLADASQDPDLFQWEEMAAHAQTPSDAGVPRDPAAAQAAFVAWVRGHVRRAAALCRNGHPAAVREALYWTGFAVHALEDLAPHRGRTNDEHSYNAYVEEKNPDDTDEAEAFAFQLAELFFRRTLAGDLKACAPAFESFDGRVYEYGSKVDRLGMKRDLTADSLDAYKEARHAFAARLREASDPNALRVRWFGELHTAPAKCDDDPACRALLDEVTRATPE